jgi:HD-GYP domain-containing protein (c-di-GMP phosphodiesterase class II)
MGRKARRDYYRQTIQREKNLQRLRYLRGTRRYIDGRHARITELAEKINDPFAVDAVKHATTPNSFSQMGEKIVKGRQRRLGLYSALAAPPIGKILPLSVMHRLALKSVDLATERHSRDCGRVAIAIFDRLSAAARQNLGATRKEARLAGELHDIGKTALHSVHLRKPANLSRKERKQVMAHALFSEALLEAFGLGKEVSKAGRQHHMGVEDGKGYPKRNAGERLAELSKLVAVADAFEAMTAGRFNRWPKTIRASIAELRKGEGTMFDPVYVDALARAFEEDKGFRKWWLGRHRENRKNAARDRRSQGSGRADDTRRKVDDSI